MRSHAAPFRRRVIGLLSIAPLIGAGMVGIAGAAVSTPVLAGLTLTPSTVAAGASASPVATATNTTGALVDVSRGVNLPNGITASDVSGTRGCNTTASQTLTAH